MQVTVKFFARLKEQLGQSELQVELDSPATVAALVAKLAEDLAGWNQASQSDLLVAVNQQHSSMDAQLSEGDEVALFPPVTGG